MMNVTDRNQVHLWINEKQQLECQLAWTLLEIFNTTPGLITPLRNMANQALIELRQLKRTSLAASAAITQAWQSQKGIVPLCRKHPQGFNSIDPNQLDAQECSDLIRLYGEFIEKAGALRARGAPGPQGNFHLQEQIKGGYQVGRDRWNKNRETSYGRHRARIADSQRAGVQATSDAHSFIISQKGGGAVWDVCDSSTVKRVDNVFGLAPVADISGTTTDTIYFTEKFSGPSGGDNIFYLLPLATIVSGGHHSLLEVALPLTMNKIIDYRIGFYRSLLPSVGGMQGAGAISNCLAAAEANHKNRHMLVYYAPRENRSVPGRPSGCFLFENRDHWAFRDFAKCVEILDSFPWMPAWPNENQLRDFCFQKRLRTPLH